MAVAGLQNAKYFDTRPHLPCPVLIVKINSKTIAKNKYKNLLIFIPFHVRDFDVHADA